jgi:hypothetical protein
LVGNETTGTMVAHRADCPDVRRAARAGIPVMTMFGCAAPLPDDIARHSCLKDSDQ